jgi:hypothetical protein
VPAHVLLLIGLSSCSFRVEEPGRRPKGPPDPTLTEETSEESWDTTIHTSSGYFEGDWASTWTLTTDYTARCDLGSETYHQVFFVDIEEEDGTLVARLDGYRMEGPDDVLLELFGTFPLSGHQEEASASTDEDDTRIRLSAGMLDDYTAYGRMEGAFVDTDGALCEIEGADVEMLR